MYKQSQIVHLKINVLFTGNIQCLAFILLNQIPTITAVLSLILCS